jgi:transglutaminase-like putative cysteine protease
MESRFMHRIIFLLAVTLVLGTTALAENTPVFEADYSSGILDRSEVLARAQSATTDVYPDAEEVLVGSIRRSAYRPDGTYVQWHEEYLKVLTEKARREHRTISSHYTIPYQRGPEDCRIDLVEIIKPDGRTITINVEEQGRTMVDPSSMSKNIYNPNDKIIQVNIGGLEVGDVLHYIMFDRIVQPRMAGSWSDWLTFESTRPIQRSVVEIFAPKEKPLEHVVVKDRVAETLKYTTDGWGGGTLHRWVASGVPRMFPEPKMPSAHTLVQRALVSTNPDWESVSKWYWDLSFPHFEPSPDIKAKVIELTASHTTPREKIRSLFDFVSQEIRYMGITAETTSPGYEPHDVADTFADRHGVCRDKAALLVSMIRESGIEAFPTLIHSGQKKDREVPQPYFNHAIVAARVDGEYVLMDPTDESTRELLPSYLDDCSFLVATPNGETLMTSPIEPSDVNLLDIETLGTLDAEGNLEGETIFRFNGINDNAYRGYFARIKPEERRRLFESLMKRVSPRARVTDIQIHPEDMQDTSMALTVNVSFSADDTFVSGDALVMVPLPIMGTRVGMVNFIVGETGLDVRKYPLKTGYACGVKERIRLEIAPELGSPVLIPSAAPVTTDAIRWSMVMAHSNGVFEVNGDFRLDVAEFSPDAYLELKETLRGIERSMRQMPAFAYASGDALTSGSDALLEDAQLTYDVTGKGSWVEKRSVRKRVLTYAGIKKNSELKLHYNPVWETVTLDHAKVTAPDGSISEISAKEMNVMDASWVGSAPRYPAGKTLVASFPAVAIGSVIDYAYTREKKDRQFFASRDVFGGFDAVAHKLVSVLLAKDVTPKIYMADNTTIQPLHGISENGRKRFAWESEPVAAVVREDDTPPAWDMFPSVFISTGSWDLYAAGLKARLKDVTSAQTNAVAQSLALTADALTDEDKLRRIRDFVTTRIRRVGPGLTGLPLSAISPADTTLRDGYGNMSDHAVLLSVMITAAGMLPEFVVSSSLPDIERFRTPFEMSPNPDLFTTLLVRVKGAAVEGDEAYLYFGDSNQYDKPGATGFENMLAMELAGPSMFPIESAYADTSKRTYRIFVDAQGKTRVTIDSYYYGSSFGAYNKRYSEMTPEARRRHFQELVAGVAQSAKAVGDLRTNFESYPGQIRFTVDVPDWAIRDGDYLYFDLPNTLSSTFYLRADTREHPYFMAASRDEHVEISIECPPGFRPVIVPEDIKIKGFAGTSLNHHVDAQNAKGGGVDIVSETHLQQQPVILKASDYASLLSWQSALSHRKSRTVVLKRDIADADKVSQLP